MAETVQEFFDGLAARADAEKTAGMNNSYLFDIEGAGQWLVAVNDGAVSVTEAVSACGGAVTRPTTRQRAGSVPSGRKQAASALSSPIPTYGPHARCTSDNRPRLTTSTSNGSTRR